MLMCKRDYFNNSSKFYSHEIIMLLLHNVGRKPLYVSAEDKAITVETIKKPEV